MEPQDIGNRYRSRSGAPGQTTASVSDDPYRAAKAHTAVTGQSVGSVTEDDLPLLLGAAPAASRHHDLPA